MVKDILIDWIINLVNLLIYTMILMKAIGTLFFNTFDLVAALVGIVAGVLWLFIKVIKE
ncbi:MAG: hypothetical protein KJ905_03190 [Nanoarchaeota archaeon]|nr:hypothetical protein [Nanoarchaeota archaeon]MBU1501753.1 hypothetical protein [Nanoarchaeota archaeon]